MPASFEWDFEPRPVTFSIAARATFHPSIGNASISVPWFDEKTGTLSSTATLGPLNSFEVEAAEAGQDNNGSSLNRQGAVKASMRKDLGNLPVTLDLVRRLQRAVLPISVHLGRNGQQGTQKGAKGMEDASQNPPAAGAARIHLGPLLLAGGCAAAGSGQRARPCEVAATWTETIGVAGLYSLELRVMTDVPVLSQAMLERLLPACFTVEAVRGLPNERWLPDVCEDVFVELYPRLSSVTAPLAEEFPHVRSACRPHNTVVRFAEPAVWLLGLVPPHVLREWMQHEGLVVEVHDRDPHAGAPQKRSESKESRTSKQDDENSERKRRLEATHPHGLARFTFGQLLEAKLEVALRAEVFPARGDKKRRRAEAMSDGLLAQGLLEAEGRERATQRAALDKREDTADYHSAGTVCTIRATLAAPIQKAAAIQAADEEAQAQRWTSSEQRDRDSNIWIMASPEGGRGGARYRAKLPAPEGGQVEGPWRRRREDAESDERRLVQALGEGQDTKAAQAVAVELGRAATDHDCRYERYGRFVLVVDDSDTSTNRALLDAVRAQNAQVLGISPEGSALSICELTEEQRADPHLDLLTGFAVLDGNSRIYVVEGLRDRGLKRLLQVLPRNERANSEKFRLLHHPEVAFSERIYVDFGPRLKQIKIRMPLEKLSSKPELYSVMGIMTEDTLAGMAAPKLVMELKNMDRARSLRQGTSFPTALQLKNFEILYGGYATDQEIHGEPSNAVGQVARTLQAVRKVASNAHAMLSQSADSGAHTAEERACLQQAAATMRPGQGLDTGTRRARASTVAPLDMQNTEFEGTLTLRGSASAPDFKQANREVVKQRSEENAKVNDLLGKKRQRQTPFLEGQQVHLYSGQKLNSAELQKEWMRKHMDTQESDKIWTFCPAYNSCTFEFAGGAPPGVTEHHARCPNDSYARLEGDARPVWRNPPPRPKEEFRKPARDVGPARSQELREAFVENEWRELPVRDERRKPLAVHVRFEPDKVPHRREIAERPFDASLMGPISAEFGPKSAFESVHYHGRLPGQDLYAEGERHNVQERELAASKILHGRVMRSYSQGNTRHGVTDLDRPEALLKDPPALRLRGRIDEMPRATIRLQEKWHDLGRPDKEWHARLRENDGAPPYDVHTGAHLKRDPEVGTRRACMSGTLAKAPWRHGASATALEQGSVQYQSMHDFNLTRQPPKSRLCENQLQKSASRSAIREAEYSHPPYRRPAHYGVHLEAM